MRLALANIGSLEFAQYYTHQITCTIARYRQPGLLTSWLRLVIRVYEYEVRTPAVCTA
jgi:hypothetical protein